MVNKCVVARRGRCGIVFAVALFQRLEAMSGPSDNATAQEKIDVDKEAESASSSQGSAGAASSSGDSAEPPAGDAKSNNNLLEQIHTLRLQQQTLKEPKKHWRRK